MTTTTVTTQAELDAALVTAAAESEWTYIDIRSPRGVWLELSRASDSVSVSAFDSASVSAFGSASVRAFDSASVSAFGSASVRATPYVAVHLHSSPATVHGGVLIDVTALDLTALQQWIDYTGTDTDGPDHVLLYKAVGDNLTSERGFAYPIGESVEASDWVDSSECGGGLHFSPTPVQALSYYEGATRFLRCRVARADLRPIPGGTAKAKARRAIVVAEVDVHGREVSA